MRINKRRRREGKTDYNRRIKLLKSQKPRVIIRRTNKSIIAQYIESEEARDKVVFGVDSSMLVRYGWPKSAEGSLKSLPASYLTGFLFGKAIISKKLESPIIDFGMYRVLPKSRLQGFIKGLADSGLRISYDEGAFPDEKRIIGSHLKNKISFEEIKESITKIKESDTKILNQTRKLKQVRNT